jgi:hypothetical protein
MPIAFAASLVVQGFGLIDKNRTELLDTCQVYSYNEWQKGANDG